jgi:ribosomal protein S18 acetylase RimI-like enzyme
VAVERALGQQGLTLARIRRARPGDATVIARLANALNRHEHLPQKFTPAIVRRDALGPRSRFRVLVAEVDRRIVGYTSIIAGYNTDIAAPELWMLDLFVLPHWRRHGIGRALVAAVARETISRGLKCLQWGVRGNNTRAKRFYRRLGATIGSVRVAALTGRALTELGDQR